MEHIERRVTIASSIEDVFHFHDDTANLIKITPPSINVSIESIGTPGLGYQAILNVKQFGLFSMRWHVKITEYEPPLLMTDVQISGPFKSWKQTRRFKSVPGGTELTDIVDYEPPFGWLGRIANSLLIRRQITQMFAYRQEATKRLLES